MMNDERFDQLLTALRDEPDSETQTNTAKARVWEQLSASSNVNPVCAQYRADLPGYAAGALLESRRMLVDDHLSRCVECRKVLAQRQPQAGRVVEMPRLRQTGRFNGIAKWAVAAGIAAVSIYAGRHRIDAALAPSGPRATVEMVSGELRGANGALAVGAKLGEGDRVRTGPGSRAVLRLADGSAVEVNQMATLAVHSAWSGQTVRLDSGDVILQAAKQRNGRLRVQTRDSLASVKGTIFAVSTGVAGSLVAVAEGAVEVEQGSSQTLLKPGERRASSQALAEVTPQEAFAWSANAQQYMALLADFAKIEQKLAAAPQNTRREARLLASLPAQPLVYGAVPNLGESLTRAVDDQLRQSEQLRTWWESAPGREFHKLLDAVNTIAPHLGDEVVFVLAGMPASRPLLMAEVKAGQRATLEQSIARLAADLPASNYRLTDKLLLVSESAASLNALSATLGQGAATPFAQEIARRYQRGAGWMLGANVEGAPLAMPQFALLGIDQLRFAFFEQRLDNGADQNEAGLTFRGTRNGISSWLGAAAPAPSAEYVTSEALVAFSAVTKSPRAAFDEFMTLAARVVPAFPQELRKFETETGIRVGDDLAQALGSDFTLAVETPTLPVPGWVLAAEVRQPSTLDATIRRFADLVNQRADAAHRVTITQETAGGYSWTAMKSPTATLHWTYDRGYMVASTDRAVALKAIQTRTGGFPLVRSARFRERLPVSSTVHQSGFLWVNASQAINLVGQVVPALKSFAEHRDPVLVTLSGENDRIVASSRTRLTAFLVDMAMAAAAQGHGPNAGPAGEKLKERRNVKAKMLKELKAAL